MSRVIQQSQLRAVTAARRSESVAVPSPAGPISQAVFGLLAYSPNGASSQVDVVARAAADVSEPLRDDDFQLALYICYELHYRSFAGVDPDWEWNPTLLAIRACLERVFFDALSDAVGEVGPVDPLAIGDLLFALEAEDDSPSLSRRLEVASDFDRFREFVVHRSLYQLKEADPHSWAIPRLRGAAKAALLEVQGDEYGGGRPERMHSTLFAKTMRSLGLDERENAYLEHVPGVTLATVNVMSAFGLHRVRRGALVGHLAMFEMTSAMPNRRYGNALRRLGFVSEATDFYDEHVEADAVHENIAAYDLAGGLARSEPQLAEDIVFGARAMLELEGRFARHLLEAWKQRETSLRRAL